MGVYVKGMEMPKDKPLIIKINPDGAVSSTFDNDYRKYEAVSISPHGRLIDADALLSLDRQIYNGEIAVGRREYIFCFEVDDAPTVIPASEEGE